ncbi:ABC transporter permease [Oceanobacillus bengalensis]|uniref:ABC transporter permease n=1 Tax=Oceanobacillus bengalensis TaxID=1435466 RepID=A0A494Z9U0_9BACI|nr:ABC transporter permease [Oceanobacillus bengalensis]RKQ18809.1 ABC transporter permease [Oceanobacillus bengalensis]
MFDSHAFYKQRLSAHIKELGRYLRYILNGHMMIVIFFLISATAVYYQQALTQLPENFPTAIIIGIAFGLLVSYSPIRTLLKEPDLVFIVVAEDQMNHYFRNTLIYSFVVQLYLIFLLVGALGPLYTATYTDRSGEVYLWTIAVVLIFKAGNLIVNWWMLKVRDRTIRRLDQFVRMILNVVIFYFIINGNLLFAGITTAIFMFVFLYDYTVSKKQLGVNWELLIEKDQHRMQVFYRFANMFADVPHLKARVKKRQWLVSLVTKGVPFEKKNTYDYLFRITFIRSGDYIGMYFRLIVIGGIFIYLIPNVWMKVVFSILFLYLSIFQMMTLYHHHRTNMWIDLYPVELDRRKEAIVKLLYQLGFIQIILFSLLILLTQEYIGFIVALAGGLVFNVAFINGYVKRKFT